jgi:cytochrome P450
MEQGRRSAGRLVAAIEGEIARARALDELPDTVLGRLLAAGALPDADIPRNLLGLVAAWAASLPRAFALALDVLLDREDLGRAAAAAVRDDAGEVGRLWTEALRLQPQAPFLSRRAREEVVIAPGAAREARVRPGDVVFAVTMSAMRDRHALDQPEGLSTTRAPTDVLHFGAGLHRCFGAAISQAQLGALGTVLLRGPALRRAGPLRWGEAFPAALALRTPVSP